MSSTIKILKPNYKLLITKYSSVGQVYLVSVFGLIITAAIFFIMVSPLIQQSIGIVNELDSISALSKAESGLEIELLKRLKNGGVENIDLSDFYYNREETQTEIAITGKTKSTERTLFFGQ